MWLPRPVDFLMLTLIGVLVILRNHGMLGRGDHKAPRMGFLESCYVVLLFGAVVMVNTLGLGRL